MELKEFFRLNNFKIWFFFYLFIGTILIDYLDKATILTLIIFPFSSNIYLIIDLLYDLFWDIFREPLGVGVDFNFFSVLGIIIFYFILTSVLDIYRIKFEKNKFRKLLIILYIISIIIGLILYYFNSKTAIYFI